MNAKGRLFNKRPLRASSVFERATVNDVFRAAKLPMPEARGKAIRCPNPDHEDRRPSASIWPNQKVITCFSACGRSWGVVSLGILLGLGQDAAEVALALESARV